MLARKGELEQFKAIPRSIESIIKFERNNFDEFMGHYSQDPWEHLNIAYRLGFTLYGIDTIEKKLFPHLTENNLVGLIQKLNDDFKRLAQHDSIDTFMKDVNRLERMFKWLNNSNTNEQKSSKIPKGAVFKETVVYENHVKTFHSADIHVFEHQYINRVDPLVPILLCFKDCDLKMIIEENVEIDKYRDNYGAQAIHLAALYGRNDIILWLYSKNRAILHSTDSYGFTALHYALTSTQLSTIVFLKSLGLNQVYGYGYRPLLAYYKAKSCDIKWIFIEGMVRINLISLNAISNKFTSQIVKLKESIDIILDKNLFKQ